MTWLHSPSDGAFFEEWQLRGPGDRRDLVRASAVAYEVGALPCPVPILTVVGSKGKGTAVTYASARLAAAGLRVGTVTSPAFVRNHERIRVNGVALDEAAYADVARRLARARARVGRQPGSYLAPTGAFTIAGVGHLIQAGVNVIVLEEGLGGRSDEVSLFDPVVVAVTTIFDEHSTLLGETVPEIADDLLGVVKDTTRAVVSLPQDPEVEPLIGALASAEREVEVVADVPSELDYRLPKGLSAANAALGVRAADHLLEIAFSRADARTAQADQWSEVAGSIRLPGRLSRHSGPGPTQWLLDAAISGRGVRAALEAFVDEFGGLPDLVLAAFPDTKHVGECLEALAGLTVVGVASGNDYLTYNSAAWTQAPIDPRAAFDLAVQGGGNILAVGTISFAADILGLLGEDLTQLFVAP